MVTSSTQLQNRSFHVAECQKWKLHVQSVQNYCFWQSNMQICCRRRRGCVSSLLAITRQMMNIKRKQTLITAIKKVGIFFSTANSSLKATDCIFHGFLNVVNPGGVLEEVSKNEKKRISWAGGGWPPCSLSCSLNTPRGFTTLVNRRIFFYTFCLINICLSLSHDAKKNKNS